MGRQEQHNRVHRKKYRPPKKASSPPEFQFVSCKLTAEDRRNLESYTVPEPDLWLWLSERVEEGYKASLVMDAEHDRYIASLTGKKASGDAWNRCLSASGPDLEGSLLCLHYKFVEKLNGELWRDAVSQDEKSKFD
jgi:hypothetical protein